MRVFILAVLILFTSCDLNDIEDLGALVPPTSDQDSQLPLISIEVAGHERSIHLEIFGSAANPPVFVLHGGPGSDFRLLLPLAELADEYYVVMWDSRGAGLSERVTKDELTIDSFEEELAEVKKAIPPDRKVTLIGHSFGANVMARYTSRHPEDVEELILIDPGKLDGAIDAKSDGGAVSFLDGQDFFWQNEILTSSDHAAADYKAIDLLPKSARNWTCDGSVVNSYPFWRFGTYHYYAVQMHTSRLSDDFNWAEGIDSFTGEISILTGTCGALGEDFQRKTNLITLPDANLYTIQGAGHISLFTDYATQTVAIIRELMAI